MLVPYAPRVYPYLPCVPETSAEFYMTHACEPTCCWRKICRHGGEGRSTCVLFACKDAALVEGEAPQEHAERADISIKF